MPHEAERSQQGRIDRRGVSQRRAPETRRDLAGPRAPADAIAALEDERLQARLREQRRGHQTVDAAADDDHVAHGSATAHHEGTKGTKVTKTDHHRDSETLRKPFERRAPTFARRAPASFGWQAQSSQSMAR